MRKATVSALGVLAMVAALSGCTTTASGPAPGSPDGGGGPADPAPIRVESGGTPITFKKVLLQVPVGKEFGAHYDGLLKVEQFRYRWQSSTAVGDEAFNAIANEELKEAGYNVLGSSTSLFDTEEAGNARFLVGARIVDLTYNTYAPLAGNYSEGTVNVEWELMDANLRKVVYSRETFGSARLGAQAGIAVTQNAFRQAVRSLLADASFVETVAPPRAGVAQEGGPGSTPIRAVSLDSFENDAAMIRRCIDSVITIRTEGGHASGVVISEDGYAVTNHHAIRGQSFIDVIFANGFILKSKVVATDPEFDLALLKIEGSGFKALPFAPEGEMSIADEVFAIGTPAVVQLGQSVTKGIVSGRRLIEGREYIQTDVTINPGNSGGPLLDKRGRILGLVTMKLVSDGLEGLGFCIPNRTIFAKLRLVAD